MQKSNKRVGIAVIVLFIGTLVWMTMLVVKHGWLPAQKSTLAPVIDAPFYFVVWASAILTVLVVALMIWFIWKYSRKSMTERSELVEGSHTLETAMVVIPTILCLVVFTWGFKSYVVVNVAPQDSYEIYATAKMWNWDFTYPKTGVTSTGELVVPVNRPVKLIMTSTDVLHSFFVPDMRVKHDVIPNRYTTLWFEATEQTAAGLTENDPGEFLQIFCTEYCGKDHSLMHAELRVLSQGKFDEWVETGGVDFDPESGPEAYAEYGQSIYEKQRCDACHSLDGSQIVGPSFKGLFGTQRPLEGGQIVLADEEYIRESIVMPSAKIAEGYPNGMALFNLSDVEIQALTEFIKTLK